MMSLGNESQYFVGAYYFGGWQRSPNYHLDAPYSLLLKPSYKNRKPLCGWFDDQQEVMDRELVWAARGDISFFAFLWYWPGAMGQEENKLNYPLGCYFNSKNKAKDKIKFCIVYTNHDKFDILPGKEWDYYSHLWTEWMDRDDYLRISVNNNEPTKPLFIIWSPQQFHDHWRKNRGGARAALDKLRVLAFNHGLPGLNIAGCGDPIASREIFENDGYDIITGYNFHWIGNMKVGRPGIYDSLALKHIPIWDSMTIISKAAIPVITSGWDLRPWPEAIKVSSYYEDRSPKKYKHFCQITKKWIDKHENQVVRPKTVLIYAWNELGEGGYILPTVGDGYAFLDATKEVFCRKLIK